MEPYLFRELLLDIAKEIQSERSSIVSRNEEEDQDEESDIENINDYDESFNSAEMEKPFKQNEKRVKFS